ncbi:spore germination protein [Psychrobacillus sp. NEAU-3TGS]|uniref:spore germination protein n=1 Tax=Psychrobacillus sp. NEAU-3TGS TaxID=2995412 RepID=UPI002497FEF4|nr:spore germination protein [Psychrobacillus sp. NEAU-3TGS]MDI2588910.1 spore germination protein [Psychrobacillus sp. NEAU-3TGS]
MGFFYEKNNNQLEPPTPSKNPVKEHKEKQTLKTSLQANIKIVKATLGESTDIVIREIRIGNKGTLKAGIMYTDGLSDAPSIQKFIMESLMLEIKETELESELTPNPKLLDTIKDFALTVGEIRDVTDFDMLFTTLLSGNVILLIDGYSEGMTLGNKRWAERGVTESTTQTVIRGPREAFSENMRINTALIRRKIKDPNLWMESRDIGKRTKTNIAVMYIKGIANDDIVEELRLRLDRIDIDGILESGNIEELIQDSQMTTFPTVYNSERPDVVAAAILEGRIAIIVDGTPFVLTVPALFVEFFQSSEDYYQRADFTSLVRILRFFSFGIALLAPALFIAATTFHHEMIPTALLINLAAQREGVPFPAFIEALIMEITFEILREAGLRMPRAIGSAMSIVGAFVIGTAAVEAGMISAAMVIVVSITAIASFVSPTYDMAMSVRILRFVFMGLAASFGLFGITVGLIALILHLCSLRSYGIPYMYPIAPFNISGQKDTFIRLPIWKMFTRTPLISQENIKKQQNPASAKPGPEKDQ